MLGAVPPYLVGTVFVLGAAPPYLVGTVFVLGAAPPTPELRSAVLSPRRGD